MSPASMRSKIQLIQTLSSRALEKKIAWKQKSRAKWLNKGDKNSRYFHRIANIHASCNKVSSLDHLRIDSISSDEASQLEAPFSIEEVKSVIDSLSSEKAPGPNGFPIMFFQRCWKVIRADVMAFFKEFFDRGRLSKGLGASFITLNPKMPGAASFKDFKSISLVRGPYKILAKVLTSWLKQVIDRVISGHQSAFITGRQIIDSALIANECLNSSHRSEVKSLVCKIDIEKAYDHVDWNFLDYMMKRMGFGDK
ncbi:uncharacterized protein LOC131251912 [Magnolia sinica]|uniref:uncharacterized protein LOC131251912 n=1 Tax=Magnolia sinica TaxID=86752 RepID=UPI00265993E4|nr:uncharacterized protein LOC131251912 [Magnolia sinica]